MRAATAGFESHSTSEYPLHDIIPGFLESFSACAGHVARRGEKRNAYRLFVGKPEGKRPLGRPRHRWVDNIRKDLGEVGWGDVD
jgi:hypothetical protein